MYHVSPIEGLAVLEPYTPACAGDLGEPLVPRVCAAPTIGDCLNALGDLEHGVEYYGYRIDAQPHVDNVGVVNWPIDEGAVIDAYRTREVWYFTPTACTCLGPIFDEDGYRLM